MSIIADIQVLYNAPAPCAAIACKYCGASDTRGAVIYAKTRVCLDCALLRGSDK